MAAPEPVPFSPPKPVLERSRFLRLYQVFCNLTGHSFQESTVLRKHQLDVHALWAAVRQQGGYSTVTMKKQWAATARLFRHPPTWTNSSFYFKTVYERLGLNRLEEMLESGEIPLTSIAVPIVAATESTATLAEQQQLQLQLLPQFPPTGSGAAVSFNNASHAPHDATAWPGSEAMLMPYHQQQQQQHNASMLATAGDLGDCIPQQAAELEAAAAAAAAAAAVAALTAAGVAVGGGPEGYLHHTATLSASGLLTVPLGPAAPHANGSSSSSSALQATELEVSCGAVHGVYHLQRHRVTCLCDVCVASAGPQGFEMAPTEFERHGGCGSYKKWKKSIQVQETGCNLGTWLKQQGIEILSQSARTKAAKIAAQATQHSRRIVTAASSHTANGGLQPAAATGGATGSTAVTTSGARVPYGLQALPASSLQLYDGGGATLPAAGLLNLAANTDSILPQQQQLLQQQQQHIQSMQQQQQLVPCMHLQQPGSEGWPAGGEAAPSNNLAGMWQSFGQHQPHAAAAPAASTGGGGGSSEDQSSSLVGMQLELWSQPDYTWFSTTVEAFDPVSQLHLLRFEDDGELETADLQEEQWRLVAAAPPAPPPAAAPEEGADWVGKKRPRQADDEDVQVIGVDAAAAAAAAATEQSVRERPLRVVFDSSSGLLRVLLAADLLQAEEIHIWQQQQQEQEQQEQHEQQQHQQQRAGQNVLSQQQPAAAAAELVCSSTSSGLLLPQVQDTGLARAMHVDHQPVAPSAGSVETAYYDSNSQQQVLAPAGPSSSLAQADGQHASSSLLSPDSSLLAANRAMAQAGHQLPAVLQGARSQVAAGQHPSDHHENWQSVLPRVEAQEAAAAADVPVEVVCNTKHGTYLIKNKGVVCHCATCVEQHALTGALMAWSPSEFEKHAGMGHSRKWRISIKVVLADNKRMGLGAWLECYEQQQAQQLRKHHQELLLLLQQQQQQQMLWQEGGSQAGLTSYDYYCMPMDTSQLEVDPATATAAEAAGAGGAGGGASRPGDSINMDVSSVDCSSLYQNHPAEQQAQQQVELVGQQVDGGTLRFSEGLPLLQLASVHAGDGDGDCDVHPGQHLQQAHQATMSWQQLQQQHVSMGSGHVAAAVVGGEAAAAAAHHHVQHQQHMHPATSSRKRAAHEAFA